MHPNPIFRREPESRARAFAASRGFGVLTMADGEDVLAAHIPFLLEQNRVEAHLVRSNPIAKALRAGPRKARLIVSGPDGYISPDWYGEPDLVPTWNYVAVHLAGPVELIREDQLHGILERLSARFEAQLTPKPPWTHEKMTEGVMERMMRAIVPLKLKIETIESTFKLNQNRSASARLAAADNLATGQTPGMETLALATMLRNVQ